ncbi:condensation domain-containing protein [Saccharothrix sp. S26]|uniref:condensation domain-containing protein n=1 Tax=Saccharothrix sp. S26 TaxID=2907215 RepID=UPI001F1FA61E|nr:condensation domain-containing protein [Saccharothrix sp. S26]MCE6996429.1 condensation domain-containing protein [Saccharothrix sp. S26]
MRYPLSFAQRRFLASSSRLAVAAWLDGPVDPVALQRAVDDVVARHAVLRTGIVAAEQVVSPVGGVVVEHIAVPDDVARAEAVAADLVARPFDLEHPPLVRVALIRVRAELALFVLVAHPVVADGGALGIVLAELSAAYRGDVVTSPWMDYGDYAVWQRERLRGEELDRRLGHWREVFPDVPAMPSFAGGPVASVSAVVPGAPSAAAVLAGYAVVLSWYGGQADVVVGVPVSGRIRVELEPVVGPFADVVPVRVSPAGSPTFAELVARAGDAMATALAHDEVPLDVLAEGLGAHLPGHAVRFTPEPPVTPVPELPGVRSRAVRFPSTAADLDLIRGEGGELTLVHRVAPHVADWLLTSLVATLEHADLTPARTLPPPPAAPTTGPAADRVGPVGRGLVRQAAAGPAGDRVEPASGGFARSTASEPAADGGAADRGFVRTSVPDPAAGGLPTQVEIERTMALMWAELVHASGPVGVHDNLFGLGGGSLTAVRFAARVAETYGVTLPLDRIFTSPTVAALAEVVAAQLAPDVEAGLAGLSDDELDDLLHAVMAARDRRRTGGGDQR